MTKPTEFVRVMGFFAVMIVVNAGGLKMEVKRGENVTLLDEKSGLQYVNEVKQYEAQSNCENRTRGIIIYCSSKVKENGCRANNSSTVSLQIENNSVFLTPLDASKEGCYVVQITGYIVVEKHVVVKGSLETAEAWTNSLEQLNIIAVGIGVFTAVVILAIIGFINCICQKTQSNPDTDTDAGDGDLDETISFISTTSGDQLPGSIFREPPFIHPSTAPALFSAGSRETPEAYTTSSWTEDKETARTDSLSSLKQSGTSARDIVGGIFGSLSVVAAVIGVIYYICKKKKQKNPGAGDPDEIIPLSSNINGAGKPDTGESSKMVDEANSSVDFVVQVLPEP